jgi:hypothetical protein
MSNLQGGYHYLPQLTSFPPQTPLLPGDQPQCSDGSSIKPQASLLNLIFEEGSPILVHSWLPLSPSNSAGEKMEATLQVPHKRGKNIKGMGR